MKGETVITCMNWNKKESTYINKICLQRQKNEITSTLIILKKKKKTYGLSFIWSLDLGALSVATGGISFSFSLETPPTSRVVEARSFEKLPQVEEPLLLCPKRCHVELQVLWLAPTDWMGADSEVKHPRMTWWLEGLLPFDQKQSLELVWLEGKRRFSTFSARRKHQSLLG